jgi:Mitochondrial 28S ribosomal protein S22.
MIVVRGPNGVLRKATREERYRLNETYFPQSGRSIRMPHMFEEEYLKVSPSFNRVNNFNFLSKTDTLYVICHVLYYSDSTCMQANWLSVVFFLVLIQLLWFEVWPPDLLSWKI